LTTTQLLIIQQWKPACCKPHVRCCFHIVVVSTLSSLINLRDLLFTPNVACLLHTHATWPWCCPEYITLCKSKVCPMSGTHFRVSTNHLSATSWWSVDLLVGL
jgi:hypothetical protein